MTMADQPSPTQNASEAQAPTDTPDQPLQQQPSSSSPSSFSARSASLTPKAKCAEAGLSEVHADQASLSMPPPQTWPVRTTRPTSNEDAPSDSDTPRLGPGSFPENVQEQALPDPAIPSSHSFSENDVKRMSISSIYSMASARGIPSSAASANGSDTGSAGTTPRSVSGFMASTAGKQGDTGVSNVVVTTGSQGSAGGNLAPREHHHHLPDILKRNHSSQIPRSDPSAPPRAQPSRDRSRAKRRLSGSTAASSHSPSSDRTLHHKDKEEGLPPFLSMHSAQILSNPTAKPAPLGLIGVCALDVKARSKPSRNILNRLLANREFDVKIFGDKVILDEGMWRENRDGGLYDGLKTLLTRHGSLDIENWPVW